MKNYWIHGGIGASVFFMLLLIFNYFVKDNETFMYLTFTALTLSLLFAVFSKIHKLHSTRTVQLDVLTYFKEGMKVAMIYVLLCLAFLYLFFNVISPQYLSDKIEEHVTYGVQYYKDNVDTNKNLQQQTLKQFTQTLREQASSMYSTKITLPFVAILMLFLGTLYSLFLGVYYRFLLKNF